MASSAQQFTEKDWNQVRAQFTASIMVDTSLMALCQNVELPEWPLDGPDEKPSKYLDFSWDELQRLPEFRVDPKRIQLLVRVLRETMAFDAPFQEMVRQSEKTQETEYAAVRTLNKLGIPEEYPISLTNLSAEAKDFCRSQGFRTLGEYTRMSQKISQLIIMEGDFRAFLNALSHLDEKTIARYLPYRSGEKGLHLAEAIGHLVRRLPEPELLAVARAAGYKNLTKDQANTAAAVSKEGLAAVESRFREDLGSLIEWFKDEAREWRTNNSGVQSIEYRLRVLHDPVAEIAALRLTRLVFGDTPAPAAAATTTGTPVTPEKAPASPRENTGLWSKIRRLFGG